MEKFLFFRGFEQEDLDLEGTILSSNVNTTTVQDDEEQYRKRYYEQMKLMETKNKISFNDILSHIFSDKMSEIYDKIWSIIVFGFLGLTILLTILSYFL
jgi:hypothetical protein